MNDLLAIETIPGKICSKCGVLKPDDEFYFDKTGIRGRRSACKVCRGVVDAQYRKNNRERIAEKNKKWFSEHSEYLKEYGKQWRAVNKERRKYQNKRWCQENKERKNEMDRKWHKENRERTLLAARKSSRKQYNTPQGKINSSIRRLMLLSLQGKSKNRSHWEDLVGFTADQLKTHLEKRFKPGMTWENYGRNGWHIDHKIPIAAFNYEIPGDIDFKRCWSLKNLSPLESSKNCSKGARIDKPFQPSLAIGVN
jgi:HrpA-like RNA helicase